MGKAEPSGCVSASVLGCFRGSYRRHAVKGSRGNKGAYYGIAGNIRALQRVYRAVERYWYKMLCSRSRKGSFPWAVFHRIKVRFPLQQPRLALPYRELQAIAVL